MQAGPQIRFQHCAQCQRRGFNIVQFTSAIVLVTTALHPQPITSIAIQQIASRAVISDIESHSIYTAIEPRPENVLLVSSQSFTSAVTTLSELSLLTYLPMLHNPPGPFNPSSNITLTGGTYNFTSFNIPLGITVTLLDGSSIIVSGDVIINGALQADCHSLALQGLSNVSISGTIDNHCSNITANPGDLSISATPSGTLSIGTPATGAPLQTSGNLEVTNDTSLQDWEFDVMPFQRSSSKLPPVCSAQSDTLEDTVVPDFPIDVSFFGNGADPDGGPVTYQWVFGDWVTATSGLQNPTHSYTTIGVFDVTLTVTDDDGQICEARLRLSMDDSDADVPAVPSIYIEPEVLVVEAGRPASFTSVGLEPQGQALTYTWSFGDSGVSSAEQPIYIYTTPGRYRVTLTLTDTDNMTSSATAAIYVYAGGAAAQFVAQQAKQVRGDCVVPGPNVFNPIYTGNMPPAAPGRNGKRAVFRGRGDIFLGGATNLKAQDGGDGVNRTGSGDVMGGSGGAGGSLHILVAGTLTLCGGARFENGNGGKGGNATSNTPPSGMAWAKGGNGGKAGAILEFRATTALTISAPVGNPVIVNPGKGGDGGRADGSGGNGAAACPRGQDGASAKANGGNGGDAGKRAFVAGAVNGNLGAIRLEGGKGGKGGAALADGGNGGDATCVTTATGGDGRAAEARGGRGGNAKLSGVAGFALAADAFTAGSGGQADALGGIGGNAMATPPGGTTANGGRAGKARAVGGNGGAGRFNGKGGDANATAFPAGNATATGSPGGACADGGGATAIGGLAAYADAIFGKAGGPGPAAAMSSAVAGKGGNANAMGGKGGDCPVCPAGKGGAGGPAIATGQTGGNATGNGVRAGGNGGDANATGGLGGLGANCCQKLNDKPGGDGGKGGNATSTAGLSGVPAGSTGGANGVKGGDGGNGGDGQGPGSGGAKGIGVGAPVDIPDGIDGLNGLFCPVPVVWYIYHSTIPDGAIVPGSNLTLTTALTAAVNISDNLPISPTGQVQAHFMSNEEFGQPTQYLKNGAIVQVQSGGISYSLSSLLSFPVVVVQVDYARNCAAQNCVELIGYAGGQEVARVGNTSTTPVTRERLSLPVRPDRAPPYDAFRLTGSAFSFDHWWIVIVDP